MTHQLYVKVRDAYEFETVNRDRGLEITEGRSPEASYNLPEGEMNLYSFSPSLRDRVHPFRPSGSVIVETFLQMGDIEREMYLSGTESQFLEMDEEIIEMLEQEDSPDYCKKIL